MKRHFLIFLILCIFAIAASAQKRSSVAAQRRAKGCATKILVDPNKPMAFLTFVRRERIEPSDRTDDPNNLFFKLTNNTCWPIWLDMSGTSDERYGQASLYFSIEDKASGKRQSGSMYCHVCSNNPLGSGRSIIFSIPLRDADRGALMRLRFEFKWELMVGDYESSNSLHTVAYYFSGLPESVLPKLAGR